METATQLKELKDEIDGITSLIAEKETEWKNAASADKAVYLDFIKVLNTRLDAARAHRHEITLRLPVPVPAPGKNTPSRPRRLCPPSTREHAKPPARCRVP